MKNIKNITIDMDLLKKGLKKTAFILITGVSLGCALNSCRTSGRNNNDSVIETTVNTTTLTNDNIEPTTSVTEPTTSVTEPTTSVTEPTTSVTKPTTSVTEPTTDSTTETTEIETTTQEEVITELNVEIFNKKIDEIEKANAEAGFNLRRENLQLVYYINNKRIATPELTEKIESYYNYNKEAMLNEWLKITTAYNNDRTEYYKGEDDKVADQSLLFADKIDRETIKEVIASFDELNVNAQGVKRNEISYEKFDKMIRDVMAKNKELGINLSREEVAITVYSYNDKQVTPTVMKYAKLQLKEGQTIDSVTNNTLNIYKAHNKKSKKDFDLNYLQYETYYVESVVDTMEGYMRNNDTINGYTKDQLTVGGQATVKLIIDDAFASIRTTGYTSKFEANIDAITEANMDSIFDIYNVLGTSTQAECEEKTLTHTK